jgi:arginine/lysine/ornithine decarboxylase
MKTPICDFVNDYDKSNALKLHMPGHKGKKFLGFEGLDITEIDGADSLYEASGIIAESERNASALFGCDTYYSTEGSSQCIRAMVYLISIYAREKGEKPLVLAGRNAHKTFHSAVALLDIDVEWIYPETCENYLSCNITAEKLAGIFKKIDKKPTAVYLTTPDYLGNVLDIASISKVCRENGVLLAIDNAHGAYLKFLTPSKHPIDLGADICCDSAHKTLPVLTGGAYLHLGGDFGAKVGACTKNALALFGSTSPSYLILQSLDAANSYLENYADKLSDFVSGVDLLKGKLIENGYELYGDEALKITVKTKKYGYFGYEFAKILNKKGIVCEFSDPDFVVLMLTPEIEDLDRVVEILLSIPKSEPINLSVPSFKKLERAVSIREAILSPSETLTVDNCLGRVVAISSVGCPPAVPIAVAGEIIDENALECFKYYGIKEINVVK